MDNKDNINTVLKFMPKSQAMCFIAGLNGAEQEHFKRIANKIAEIIVSIEKMSRCTCG